jgi:hypothetical protein
MDKLINFNNSNNTNNNSYYNLNNKNYNNCKILIDQYFKTYNMYTKISKTNCVTNSCKRRKEELIGCLKDLHKIIEICK